MEHNKSYTSYTEHVVAQPEDAHVLKISIILLSKSTIKIHLKVEVRGGLTTEGNYLSLVFLGS